ncbi:MAG: hypothetical protein JOS17DRAFT_733627 [Linnemannia elongata]|nr:MAG: hypothetical protein JOS17DRAFT_733627 [Linnemannia elongata]
MHYAFCLFFAHFLLIASLLHFRLSHGCRRLVSFFRYPHLRTFSFSFNHTFRFKFFCIGDIIYKSELSEISRL